jgi:hypothetical protein
LPGKTALPKEVQMQAVRRLLYAAMILGVAAEIATPASATTLVRASLDRLVEQNEAIVIGEVRDARSYWNEEGTLILTDVHIKTSEVLKGDLRKSDLTLTLLGGKVGDQTVWIVGNAELAPGKKYLLFLNRNDIPGAPGSLTVRHYSQGVFEIVRARDGLRAISQANAHPLQADALGFVDPPGEAKGLPLETMIRSIREMAGRQSPGKEVQ